MRLLALNFALALGLRAGYPGLVEDDFMLRDFRFVNGESLAEVRIHYRTLGQPSRDSSGVVRNAVLILHGTGGSGAAFLDREYFHGELFGQGQPLDATRFYLILPDNIGHGKSTKPSDGLGDKFPHYGYQDMVEAQRRLLTEKLGVTHLRLILGTSMGCMHAWVWGTEHPAFADALMPLACLPYPVTGINLVRRQMMMDLWRSGTPEGQRGAAYLGTLMTANVLAMQRQGDTRDDALTLFQSIRKSASIPRDAFDAVYAYDASRDYNPAPKLDRIKAAVMAVNFTDDEVNPPELGILEREIRRVPRGKALVLPGTPETWGHGDHSHAVLWKSHLLELLRQ